jgi:hypothetical protein
MAVGVLGGAGLNETLAGGPNRLDKRAFGGVSLDVDVRTGLSIEADGKLVEIAPAPTVHPLERGARVWRISGEYCL